MEMSCSGDVILYLSAKNMDVTDTEWLFVDHNLKSYSITDIIMQVFNSSKYSNTISKNSNDEISNNGIDTLHDKTTSTNLSSSLSEKNHESWSKFQTFVASVCFLLPYELIGDDEIETNVGLEKINIAEEKANTMFTYLKVSLYYLCYQ